MSLSINQPGFVDLIVRELHIHRGGRIRGCGMSQQEKRQKKTDAQRLRRQSNPGGRTQELRNYRESRKARGLPTLWNIAKERKNGETEN